MATFTQEIQAVNNDGYKWPGAFWNWYIDDLYVGNGSTVGAINLAVRFVNVTIPAGSTITSAKLSFKTWYDQTADIHAKIYGMDEDNTAVFPNSGQPADVPTDRTKTTAAVDWDRTDTLTAETYYDTPDITSVVQEIVDRGSWASGNAMGFIIVDDGFSSDTSVLFYDYDRWDSSYASGKYPVLTITYTEPASQIYKTLGYKVRKAAATIEKALKYCIGDKEDTPVTFSGIKVAKDGHNVLNTDNPHHLKFSSDYNTLKYFMNGSGQIHVEQSAETEYTVSGYVTHDLGYFPFAIVYAKDDLMESYQPLGRFQAGSGAYRQFFYYMTTTRLYFVVIGWTGSEAADYIVNFYYKIFKNNLNL